MLSGIGTWSWAWKVTAAASSFWSVTGGSSSVRSTVRWLATPIRTRLLRPLLGEQLAEHLAEGALVDHFAVAHRVRGERTHLGALGQDRAVDARLDGGDEARLDVQSDDVGAAARRPRLRRGLRFSWGIRGDGSLIGDGALGTGSGSAAGWVSACNPWAL